MKAAAIDRLKAMVAESEDVPLPRLFSARHEFGSEWSKFLRPLESESKHVLKLGLIRERFPFPFRNRQFTLKEIELFLKFKGDILYPSGDLLHVFVRGPETDPTAETSSLPGGTFNSLLTQYAGLPRVSPIPLDQDLLGNWQLEVQKADVETLLPSLQRVVSTSNTAEQPLTDLAEALDDIYVVCRYAIGDQVG